MRKMILVSVALLLALSVMGLLSNARTANAGSVDPTLDADNDGCTEAEELAYGMDPENPYDFFDTPPYDGTVTITDIGRVVNRFGTAEGGTDYYPGFDRNVLGDGSIGPPDGTVTISDIGLVVSQFGRACTTVEWCNGDVKPLAMLDTEPYEATPAALWRDCFEVLNENDDVVDYVIREAMVEVESEELTAAEVTALGLTLPEPWWDSEEDNPLSVSQAAAFPPWRNYYCKGTVRTVNLAGRAVNTLKIVQRWTTTPYTNIVWPPSRGTAWAESNFLWHVASDPEARPAPYPLVNYSPGIVAIGQTFARSRHALSIGPITVFEQTLTQRLTFRYGFNPGPPPWCTVRGTAG